MVDRDILNSVYLSRWMDEPQKMTGGGQRCQAASTNIECRRPITYGYFKNEDDLLYHNLRPHSVTVSPPTSRMRSARAYKT